MQHGVLDASLILTLSDARSLSLLWQDPELRWHVSPLVRDEILSEPARSELSAAILKGRLGLTELDTRSEAELAAFGEWSGVVDAGEAEAIAIGICREWVVGIEDRYAQRQLTRRAGPGAWMNAAGLLVRAERGGRMTLGDANAVFVSLDCYAGYRKRGVLGLEELLGGDATSG